MNPFLQNTANNVINIVLTLLALGFAVLIGTKPLLYAGFKRCLLTS